MRVNGINNMYSSVNTLQISSGKNVAANVKAPVMTKDQMAQLLSFMTYQQNKMNLKLVRIASQLYTGKSIDQLA
ncbi:conserved hypothetical protein [Thermosipho africanus TCF52B]|uniref:Uncharacterized protein n=1 Tax=Thermosipho africanus (strain TCF52B) TaxID=484019 RepID=B7IHR6_THEAB|nr:hypothetical protein [Thermosipho africanus]ACJ75630.1 conserved hypothetical protein [Thermosipho africanus TCF52B]